jgi:cytochrome c biogenesis protein CcmG/thiol:disulfide interchange protein DsbE
VLAAAVLLLHGTAVAAEVRPGARAPLFDLPSLDGARYSLDLALQDHPVLIAFISFPCKPCEDSVPSFNAICDLHDQTERLEIVCIAVSEPVAVERLVRSERFDCRAQVLVDGVTDGQHRTAEAYGVLGTPMFFLVGRNGTVLWKHVGRLRWEKAGDSILEAIAAD